jgi:hypothetical protein
MIWINFFILLSIEIFIHAKLINSGIDPTPDGEVSKLKTGLFAFRFFIVGLVPLALASPLERLVFGPLLNIFTGKDWWHLGNGPVDKLLNLVYAPVRIVWLLILSSGFIYGFYHTDLL